MIDFVPHTIGVRLPDVESFSRKPGGAPANVTACAEWMFTLSEGRKDAFGEAIWKEDGVTLPAFVQRKKAAPLCLLRHHPCESHW